MNKLFKVIAGLCARKRFIGLFDADGDPLFEGDKYITFSTNEKGERNLVAGRKVVIPQVIEFHTWGDCNAGFCLPLTKMIKKLK